jgi:uncharacterized membrane protein YfcA
VTWYQYAVVVAAGVAAGFINVLAGNGSLISLPALIFVGLPPGVANATNRVSIVFQNLVGGTGFYRQGVLDTRGALTLSIPMVLGSIVGATLAVDVDDQVFQRMLAVAMIAMLALMLLKPERWIAGKPGAVSTHLTPARFIIFFAIGVYGGFLQAGVGIFLLVALVLEAGYDIIRANAVKVAVTLASAVVSLAIFAANLKVNWTAGLVLACGSMMGAWLATRFAAGKGARWVRWFVIVVVAASAAYLLGVFAWLERLLS